jgi:RNA polymerase sigma-70 factor, ECF subfamily
MRSLPLAELCLACHAHNHDPIAAANRLCLKRLNERRIESSDWAAAVTNLSVHRSASVARPDETVTMNDYDTVLQPSLRGRAEIEQICRHEWRPIYNLIYRTVQNRAEAQDLTQEVFLRAVRSLERYEDRGDAMHGLLVTVALNLLRDRWRRRRPIAADVDALPYLATREPGPEQLALDDLDDAAIQLALTRLPDEQQRVIQLRVIEGRSSQEVAELLGRNAAAVRQIQRRALLALREALRTEVAR